LGVLVRVCIIIQNNPEIKFQTKVYGGVWCFDTLEIRDTRNLWHVTSRRIRTPEVSWALLSWSVLKLALICNSVGKERKKERKKERNVIERVIMGSPWPR